MHSLSDSPSHAFLLIPKFCPTENLREERRHDQGDGSLPGVLVLSHVLKRSNHVLSVISNLLCCGLELRRSNLVAWLRLTNLPEVFRPGRLLHRQVGNQMSHRQNPGGLPARHISAKVQSKQGPSPLPRVLSCIYNDIKVHSIIRNQWQPFKAIRKKITNHKTRVARSFFYKDHSHFWN